ncbi:MAG: alpha/beta fold hydrolase [Spirochaetes bacterium]|nr:alpha/beta fold hydrolase [Spirochaetota bacterium]
MDFHQASKPFSIKKRSDVGILVIHGFTSTVSSVYPLGEYLARHNINVEAPCLSGHGKTWKELNRISCGDWIRDVEKALRKLKKRALKIFVSGLSLGGTLALYLAEQHPELKGVILINHGLFIKDWRKIFLPFLRFILRSTTPIRADIKDPSKQEIAYDRTPVKGAYELSKLYRMVRKNLKKVKAPVLIFKSRHDHVIGRKDVFFTLKNISSLLQQIFWLENSYHVATVDHDRDVICKMSLRFINQNL